MVIRGVSLLIAAAAILPGCASIVDGKNQVLSVDTRNKATAVSGANCKLSNDKGTWYVTAPGTTTVQRSYQDLNIQCEKAGLAPTATAVKSSTKGMAFGNILFGGIIGAGVDMASGAAYDYPSPITVEMSDLIDSAKLSHQEQAGNPNTEPSGAGEPDAPETEKVNATLASAGCMTTRLPVRFKQQENNSLYEAFCSDGRLVHAVCTAGDCRLKTSAD